MNNGVSFRSVYQVLGCLPSLEDGDVSVGGEEEDDDGLLVPDGRDLDLQPDGVAVLLVVQRLEGAPLRRLHRAVHRT